MSRTPRPRCLKPCFWRYSVRRWARVSPRARIPTTLRGLSGEKEEAIFAASFSITRRTSASSYWVRMSGANLFQTGLKNKFVHRYSNRARVYNRRRNAKHEDTTTRRRARVIESVGYLGSVDLLFCSCGCGWGEGG